MKKKRRLWKITAVWLTLAVLFSCWILPSASAEETITLEGIVYTLDSASGTASVTNCEARSLGREVRIPASVQGSDGRTYAVTSIGAYAFLPVQFGNLIELTLPEGLQRVEEHAFDGVRLWDTLVIPDSVIYIGPYAFQGNAVDVLIVGNGVQEIGEKAFANGWMMEMQLPAGAKMAPDAFEGCTDLSEILVIGAEGSLDEYLEAAGLGDAAVKYDDPNAKKSDWLQEQIDLAPSGL